MEHGPDMPRLTFRADVLDAVDRERVVVVGVRGPRVVVIPPPGEGFTLNQRGATQLAAFLRECSYRADDDSADVQDPDDDPAAVTTAALTTGITGTTAMNPGGRGTPPPIPRDSPRPSGPTPHGEQHP